MKRKMLIALACVLALCCLCGAALGESKTEYGQQIGASLDALENTFASQDKSAADSALAQVRSSLYAAVRYLAQIGEYDSRVMEIVNNANQAYTAFFGGDGNYASYMSQARAYNTQVFGDSGIDPDTGVPFIHVHRSSKLAIIEPATCVSEGLASGICDAGVNRYDGVAETAYSLDHGYEKSAPCGAYFTCETEIDPNNHAGGTAIQGQNIVCLGCGAVLAVSSSDLGQFLTSVTITSVPGNNNDNYDIELEFAETEALQFDNDVSLLYTFPAGITIPEDSNTQTAISFSSNGTTYVVSGNAVQVDTNGNMTVNFNDSDPNFERLAEAANICFQVSIHAQISEAYHEIDWNGGREGQEITVTYADPVYTVTLDPGEGRGEPITYSSADGISTESWRTVGNCQFYYEDDGSLAYRLKDDVCPSTFSPAADALPCTIFDGWQGNGSYNKLSSPQTTFTAKWKQDWDLVPAASYSLSADKSQLSGPGFTDLTITADELTLGKFDNGKDDNHDYKMAERLCLSFMAFDLTDGSGNTLGAQECYGDHTYSSWAVGVDFTAQGQENALAVYIDPQDYATAAPGVYTGEMEAYVNWDYYFLGSSVKVTFPLTLTVAHTPQDSYTITAVADPAEGGTITGAGDYAPGETVTLAPVPSEGYVFRRWRVDGIDRTYSTAYAFPALVDRALTAVFLPAAPLAPGDNALSLPGDSDSYFVFIPAVSGEHTFLLTGDTYAGVGLYQGSDYLTDGYSFAEDDIEFTYALTAGTPYTLIVSTWDNATQEIVVHVGVPEPEKYAITTDDAAQVYYYNDSFEQVFPTEAAEGTVLSLTLDDSAVPETGYYFTGEFTLNGVSLGRETSEDGLTSWPVTGFSMPAEAVTVGAVKAARENLTLTFAPGETRALPMAAWMQLQFVEGAPPLIRYDEATGTEALDVNRDGKPDLQIAFDDEAYCVNLTRMPACATFGAFSFAFTGPTDRYGTVAFTLPAPAFGPAAFTLPAALTTIEESAFEGNAAMTIVDANHVTAIGADAFKGCTNLTQIKLPANCDIDSAAFTGCGTVLVFAPSGGSTEAACETMENCVFCAFNN